MTGGDVGTVLWKERKTVFRSVGSRWRFIVNLVVPIALIGVYMPLQVGADWGGSFLPLLGSLIVPLVLVGMTIPDSFAGERERHTLETLLASRLPDRAILLGKILASVGLAWGATMIMLLFSLVTVNIANWAEAPIFFSARTVVAAAGLCFLMSAFMACLGVLVSLRAATAQGAMQALMTIVLVPAVVLQFVVFIVLGGGRRHLVTEAFDWIGAHGNAVLLVVAAAFLILDAVLFLLASARFQRARLWVR